MTTQVIIRTRMLYIQRFIIINIMERHCCPTILSALRFICRVTCHLGIHQIKGKRNCHKACDPVCILCHKNARYLRWVYHCYECKFPFCIFHFQQHIIANTKFEGFNCNCMKGDLSKITKIMERDIPKVIPHLRAEYVVIDNISTATCMKYLGILLSTSNFIKKLGMLITQI